MANADTTFAAGSKVACPCCGKAVKVTKAGKLANHGYKARAGNLYSVSADGACSGSGASDTREALLAQVESAARALVAAQSFAAREAEKRTQPAWLTDKAVQNAQKALNAALLAAK